MKHVPSEKSIGQKFGKLLVIEILQTTDGAKHKKARCICDCGNEKIVTVNRLRTGNTISCGCARKELCAKISKISVEKGIISGRIKTPEMATAKIVYCNRYIDGNLTFEQFLELSQQNCFYCGKEPSNTTNYYSYKSANNRYSKERQLLGNFTYNGLDRIDSNKLHNLDNVVPCCLPCNKAKLDRNINDFIKWIDVTYDHIHNQTTAIWKDYINPYR